MFIAIGSASCAPLDNTESAPAHAAITSSVPDWNELRRLTPAPPATPLDPTEKAVEPVLDGENRSAHWMDRASLRKTETPREDAYAAGQPTGGHAAENTASPDATVLDIQRLLNIHGWRLAEDGMFGPRTRQALLEFLEANSLELNKAPSETLAWAEGRQDVQGRTEQLSLKLQATSYGGGRVVRLEQLADTTGFDWRSRGVTIHIGCSTLGFQEYGRCLWALYETASRRIFVAERIAQGSAREHYLVLHELAHAWQFTVRGWPQAADDVSDWGEHGLEGLEAAADCLALAWGAPAHYYCNCPADAQAHMHTLHHSTTG